MKTQKLQFALTSLHNLQKRKNQKLIKKNEKTKETPSNSDNESEQENTNIDI